MKTLANMLAEWLSDDPEPGNKPTRLITASTPPGNGFLKGEHRTMTMSDKMTHKTIRAIYDRISGDPLAGMGSISKIDLFINEVIACHNIQMAPYTKASTTAKPIMEEPEGGVATADGLVKDATTPAEKLQAKAAVSIHGNQQARTTVPAQQPGTTPKV